MAISSEDVIGVVFSQNRRRQVPLFSNL